jgi:hypothetical protein
MEQIEVIQGRPVREKIGVTSMDLGLWAEKGSLHLMSQKALG